MFVPNRELGDFLLDARLISRAELDDLLARAAESESLYALVEKSGTVGEDELRRAAAQALGVSFISVAHEDISQEALMLVPEPLSRSASLAAFKQEGGDLHVMLLDMDDLPHLKFLEEEHLLRVVPHLTDRASLKRALLIYQRALGGMYAARFKSGDSEILLDALISHALLSRASEVHLEPEESVGQSRLSVRYRMGEALHSAMAISADARALAGELKKLANLSFTLATPQEGKFKVALRSGESVRVRVATLPTARGEKITLHIRREHAAGKNFTLGSLGIHGETLELLHEALGKKSGLLLVAGPAGSGKTTLIYTLLDYLSNPARSAITVEEKIEMPLPLATQTTVRRDLGQTYASSVRAALKHHPDILVIAELCDEDTAHLAASAASRGILVIAGIEANGASEGIERLLSYNIDPLSLDTTLRAAVGTRVVRKICPHCKEEYHLSRAEAAPIEQAANFGKVLAALKAEGVVEEGKQWKELLFARATGCSQCKDGYLGEIGLQEIQTQGEAPLNILEDGLFKAAQGLTSIEEVRALTL